LKNATIEIVAGHSEQNEPVFVCLGREYSFCLGREYSLVRKRPKKTSKWIEKRNDSDCCGTFGTKTNRSVLKEHPTGMKKHYTMTSRNRMQKIETPNPHDSLFAGMW